MAKKGYWTPKRKAAFKKMRAGLAKSRGPVKRRRVKRRRSPVARPVVRRRRAVARRTVVRYRNPLSAIIANPGGALVSYSGYAPKRGTKMAKRRKKSRRVSRRRRSPARRRGSRRIRRAAPRRRYARRRSPARARARRLQRGVVYINPGRRHRRSRIRRRRNPGMGGMIGTVFTPFAAGFAASFAMAAVDTFLGKSPNMAKLAKVGSAFVVAFAGRRYPRAACAAIGAIGGSLGYPMAVKMMGGMVATTPAAAVQGLGSMARNYPSMGALLSGGMGALLSDAPSSLPNVANNYMTALRNNVTDDD